MSENPKTTAEPAKPVDANVLKSLPPALEQPVPADVWAYGQHDRQVTLAGALADDPSLRGTELTPADWRARVDAYLAKPA